MGHHHEHHHEEEGHGALVRIIIAAVLLGAAMYIEAHTSLAVHWLLLIFLVPYLIVGAETLKEAAEGLAHGDPFNEHFLMAVATIGAFCIGFLPGAQTQFAEAVFVMLFFQVGELFEGFAEGRSRQSISHLMNIRPDVARVLRDGTETEVDPAQVEIGETLILRPGDRIPLDGVVLEGESALDTVALTGESLPRPVHPEDEVLSGCINLSGVLRVRSTKSFHDSTVSRVLDLVENAAAHKSRSETFITRFARVYTPIVVFAALLLALLPPLLSGDFAGTFPVWLYRALMFLIVSCPCALVLSIPLTFFGGIGGASRKGILVKGANFLDLLARTDTVVFDKTGTLTEGRFAVEAVHPERFDERHLLHLAAHVEHFSTHPVGAALRDAFPDEATDGCRVDDVREIPGQGVCAKVEGQEVCVGNSRLMEAVGAAWHDCHCSGTIIHVAIDGQYAGHIVINDHIKDDSREAVTALRELGVRRTVMLTGDRADVGRHVAETLGLDDCRAELLPQDKVRELESLLAQKPAGKSLLFVGDGINDAPVLALADVGIAMGGLGSDAAIEAADVVVMDDKPSKVALAVRISRRILRIARENAIFAVGVKLAVLVLAALGVATMWMAVFADVGVTVLAVLNAMRALKTRN
ncbi:MAG: cadmium-translocating P-type ATPase [Bacteroidales bacterium]|nr:cadmium-translocating P-type ATPase [Bacteroidales bacterium]